MTLLIISFLAGVLTVAAPCVLPLLPIIVGGSLLKTKDSEKQSNTWLHPIIISVSLAFSIVLFTLLLKSTTALLGVPQQIWQLLSGIIILCIGIDFLYPKLWEWVALKTGLHISSNSLLGKGFKQKGYFGDVCIGIALGPVFGSCSPTYAFIVAAVLPVSFTIGLTYLTAYATGLSTALLLIAYLGQSFTSWLGWINKPNFRRVIGTLFIVIAVAVFTGFDKIIEGLILDQGLYNPVDQLERSLRR